MDYKLLLEHSYATEIEHRPQSRLEYLSEYIFEFITYDSEMDVLFARKAVEVCDVITNRTAVDYNRAQDDYEWYLLMCNLPFFAKKIEWGTSIRGAWWAAEDGSFINIYCYAFWVDQKPVTEVVQFTVDEWKEFILALIEFAAPEMGKRVAS